MRRRFGWTLLVILVVQLLVADAVFVGYIMNNNWQVDPTSIQVWLAAAVVQVIGLVWIVVKYLFSPQAAPRAEP